MMAAVTIVATDKERKPTEAERDEALKDYRCFRGKFRLAVMAMCRVRLQRFAGLSYVEAYVWSSWRFGGRSNLIAKSVNRTEGGVWVINARAKRKIEAAGYDIDRNLFTWLSQNSTFLTYDPSKDPLFGDVSEFYHRYSREATVYDDVYVPGRRWPIRTASVPSRGRRSCPRR